MTTTSNNNNNNNNNNNKGENRMTFVLVSYFM